MIVSDANKRETKYLYLSAWVTLRSTVITGSEVKWFLKSFRYGELVFTGIGIVFWNFSIHTFAILPFTLLQAVCYL